MPIITERPTIKEMPAELRPRERLLKQGAGALSEIELLAILLGTGSQRKTVLDLSAQVLARFKNLRMLVDATVEELSEIKGVGLAKASQVKAALELAKRLSLFTGQQRPYIRTPGDAAALVMENLRYMDREHFITLLLNTKNQVIAIDQVSVGTLDSSSVHPRELFRNAIKRSAAALILVHNHPSGDTKPSKEDLDVTRRLFDAGRIIGIEVLDHIITGDNSFTSLKAEGFI